MKKKCKLDAKVSPKLRGLIILIRLPAAVLTGEPGNLVNFQFLISNVFGGLFWNFFLGGG